MWTESAGTGAGLPEGHAPRANVRGAVTACSPLSPHSVGYGEPIPRCSKRVVRIGEEEERNGHATQLLAVVRTLIAEWPERAREQSTAARGGRFLAGEVVSNCVPEL